jgi:zinc protease
MRTTAILCATLALLAGCAGARLDPPAPPAGSAAGPAAPAAAATDPVAGLAGERYRLVSEPDEIVSVLRNGLTVVARRVVSPALAVRGYVATGGAFEGRWLGAGLSHLLEHLVAGGSTTRRSEAETRTLLQSMGNNANAYTTFDHTAYFINTTPEHLDAAVDLLTDWLLHARITEEEFERERAVVQRELEMGKGEPERQFYYLALQNRYRVSPMRVPVIGHQEVIQRLTRTDVYEYYRLAYQPDNIVLAVAGDREPAEMLRTIQHHVRDAAPGRGFVRELPPEPAVLTPRTQVATFPQLGQALVELGFPTVPLDHPDLYALDLLATALSEGESSLLVEEIRDRLQLVSGIGASSATPEFVSGTFEIRMGLDAEKIPAAIAAVLELLGRVRREGIAEERLARARTQMRVDRLARLQTPEGIAASLATDYLATGDPHFTDRYVERIQRVTAAEVRAVAERYFDPARLVTSALVPAEYVGAGGLPRAEALLRQAAPAVAAREGASTVTRRELPNGTVLLHRRIAAAPLVTVAMYALGGLTVEDEATNGLGSLTMELLPRGTATRGAAEIATFFDSIGGSLATGMGNNTWFWSASSLPEDFARMLEVYADVVTRPAFPPAELDPVRQRILAAIASQDADWTSQAFRVFKEAYYGPAGSPYRFLATGTRERVAGFTREQVARWYRERILPSRRVVAVFGNIALDEADALVRRHLGELPAAPAAPPRPEAPAARGPAAELPSIEVRRAHVEKTRQPLAGIVIGLESDSVIGDPANVPLLVADTMTSGYGFPGGYLHEVLRGRGLVYVVHAQNSPGLSARLPGTFLAYAGTEPDKVDEVVGLMLENVARLQGSPADIQADWLTRAKELLLVALALENQTAAEQATTAVLDELYGLGFDYRDRLPGRVKAVTLADVRAVARARLSRAVVVVTTPAPERVTVKPGLRTYRSFPPVDLTPKGVQHDSPRPTP